MNRIRNINCRVLFASGNDVVFQYGRSLIESGMYNLHVMKNAYGSRIVPLNTVRDTSAQCKW